MTVIRIRELGQEPDGVFHVRVSFDDDAEYQVTVSDPADEAVEENLAWYFEEHLRYPFLDKDKEEIAVLQIADYGKSLFGQVFGSEANHDYKNLRAESFDRCRIEISGSASLHRLHWEALQDPDLPAPLSVQMPVTRRASDQPSRFGLRNDLPTLNILVVTARPDGPRDIGYRTVSRPLIEALRTSGLPVTVDLVRPGTWDALCDHLQGATDSRGSGWYHIVHFDLHGTVKADDGMGRDGQGAFLSFETAQEGTARLVSAKQVAALLATHRVPIAVLNACQSARQSESEASLAQHLAEAGIRIAVGMAYPVTVSATERAMPVLYRRIASGDDLAVAVTAARRELQVHHVRRAYLGQELDLQDWMLPVMFGQRRLRIELRDMTDDEERKFYERQAVVANEPPTEYGFVGRDLDIQAVEHRLLTSSGSNQLLVQGMAGAGKSTLLRHLVWWWQRTGLVDQAFWFSYEDRTWTAEQVVHEIRSRLLSAADDARADVLSEDAQAEQVAGLLRAARHLLILDNVESITATPAAIPHSLSPDGQNKLKAFLSRLRSGRTLVLLGSRESEKWLTAGQGAGVYPLPGLDPEAASLLVDKILARHGTPAWLADNAERSALENLVELLQGYPLPLTVVLPVLESIPPSKVLQELQSGDPNPDPAGIIFRAIEYSHGKLDPTLQNSLQMLAPFTAVIPTRPWLDWYQDFLLQNENVAQMGPIDLAAAIDQAIGVGLASPHHQMNNLVQVQPVLPWFLRSRLASHPTLRKAAEQAHYKLYNDAIAPALFIMMTSGDDPHRRPIALSLTRAEYANLRAAFDFGLRTAQQTGYLFGVLDRYLDQSQQHDTRRLLFDDAIAAFADPQSTDQQRELGMLHATACDIALVQERFDDARTHNHAALAAFLAADDRKQQANSYHQLGMVAQAQQRYAEAEVAYRQALGISSEVGDQDGTAITWHQLGLAAEMQGQFTEAEADYRQALDSFLEVGNRYRAASTWYQLGQVAQKQQEFAQAEAAYRQALNIFLEFGDRQGEAHVYHTLGVLAQLRGRFVEAESAYRQALDIFLELGDRHYAAWTYDQLGTLATNQRRYQEAQAAYDKALETSLQSGDKRGAARTYMNLGWLNRGQKRFTQAETAFRQAHDIFMALGDRLSVAEIYNEQGILALQQERYAEAEAAFRQALEIRLEADDRSASDSYNNLGAVAAQQEHFVEAEEAYHHALDLYLASDDRRGAARTYHILAGLAHQQGRMAEAEEADRQALDIRGDSGRRGMVLAQLGRHSDAVQVLAYDAMIWRSESGQWDLSVLKLLKQERGQLDPAEYTSIIETIVPAVLLTEFTAAVDAADMSSSPDNTAEGSS